MTVIYFVGGEDHDFTKSGNSGVDTATTAARRTAYARAALKVIQTSTSGYTDGWTGTLTAPQSSFWLTARHYGNNNVSAGNVLMRFYDSSGVVRVLLDFTNSTTFRLAKVNAAGTITALLTSGTLPVTTTLMKFDVFMNYSATGAFQLYVDGALIFNYSGNLVTDSATSISSFSLGGSSGILCYWSEVICADTDTRTLGLVTLAPSANGNTFSFDAGSVANINETTLDDSTVISSGTVGQVAQFTVGATGVTGLPAIKAVCVSARAVKGSTGPGNVKLGVRTGGVDYYGADVPLSSGAFSRVQGVFLTNPGTGNAWATSEISAAGFNIGVQSDT